MNKKTNYVKNRWQKALLGVVMLLLSYGLASLAIDKAYFWAYVLTFVFLVWGIKYIVRAIRN